MEKNNVYIPGKVTYKDYEKTNVYLLGKVTYHTN